MAERLDELETPFLEGFLHQIVDMGIGNRGGHIIGAGGLGHVQPQLEIDAEALAEGVFLHHDTVVAIKGQPGQNDAVAIGKAVHGTHPSSCGGP